MMKRLAIFLLIAGLIFSGYYVVVKTELLSIQTIEFTANDSMDLYEVERYSGVKIGDSYFSVNAENAEAGMLTHPLVKSVTVTKQFPQTLKMDIVYRTHFFNIQYSDLVLSVDENLIVLDVLDEPTSGYVVEGFRFDSFATGQAVQGEKTYLLSNVVDLIKLINQSGLEVNQQIVYKDDSINIYLGDMMVKFGDGESIEYKFNAFVNIYDSLKAEGITTGVIDVQTKGLPVYRPFGE